MKRLKYVGKLQLADVGGYPIAKDGTVSVPDEMATQLLRDRAEDFVEEHAPKK